ncbi:MAG: TonB-dependent receptor [Rhodothermales bacterium]|nr:TonB-dependent receptor [Rhodothermales bacterium]
MVPVLAFAQTTGKLTGRVLDTGSGEGLPGASVVILDINLGVATDVDGYYTIVGVPVGTYDIQVSFVGYPTQTVQGVDVNAGYTRELNFEMAPGVELDEIVVEYERPLIQKDAVGVPKIVSADEIQQLPVRGPEELAKIQAGVVAKDGSDELFIRGGRSGEVTFYIDGVKVQGSTGLPQSAIQQQEMLIGNINARYGDVMSGVINITTKSGSNQLFGSLEAITSQSLDAFGYNLVSGTVGGPLIKNKLSFFLSGEYSDEADSDPRYFGALRLNEATLQNLQGAPQGFRGRDASGSAVVMPIPASLTSGATLLVDDAGAPLVSNGSLSFSDGTTIAVPAGVEGSTISFTPVERAEQLTAADFDLEKDKIGASAQNLSGTGNLTWNILENARLRVGGRVNVGQFDGINRELDALFAPEMAQRTDRSDYQVFGSWTQYIGDKTFFQLQADYSDRHVENYDPRIGNDFADLLEYGNIDNPIYSTLAGYKNPSFVAETRIDQHGTPDDPSDDTEFTVQVPRYSNAFNDGANISGRTVSALVSPVGGRFNGYSKSRNEQIRFTASATTQVGLHQIEFGGEFEKRTNRAWGITARTLARYVNDGNAEQVAGDPNLNPQGYSSYDEIPFFVLDDIAGGFGYDLRGQNEIDSENFGAFLDQDVNKPLSSYNIAPYEPIYYGGYIQDKIEFNDIVLNLGVRADVFDNNTRVLKDRFSRRPICRAGDLGATVNGVSCGAGATLPGTIGSDYSVFYSGDDVIGYRDLEGNFFDAQGQGINAGDILLNGNVRSTGAQISEDMFKDYDPVFTLMPRIGVSFPITDQALFFASYGVVSQRPSSNTLATLDALAGTGGIDNTGLQPEKTTKYELGFRQRLGERSAFTISGFFHQIENLIQQREIRGASPSVYTSYENVDFGTVKGVEFDFDLRRTGNTSARINYTLAFADGTGSSNNTTSTITWVDETPPNFISPLDFDQRHKVNVSVDYRLGKGQGPSIGGVHVLENFGVNVLATVGSGFPYTPVIEPFNRAGAARATNPKGAINSARMPWSSRLDVRIDRAFQIGNANLSAFLWVQNIFDQRNVNLVWRYTGIPDNDGFLATDAGSQWLAGSQPVGQTLYEHSNRQLNWVGLPRLTRLGLRLNF